MQIGDTTLERPNSEKYTYHVKLRVTYLATTTDVHTWNKGDEWSKDAIEGEFIHAEEVGRDEDESDPDIEYVRFEVTREYVDFIEETITSENGPMRDEFHTAGIRTLLREHGIEPENVIDISGSIAESQVFVKA